MLEILITGTNIRYDGNGGVSSVHVQFQGRDPEGTINLNGYIPITSEEYQGNESIPALKEVVRNKLITRLQPEA